MLSDEELVGLLTDLESDRVERKPSIAEPDRIREAICAFANDLPDHGKPGVIFIGAKDNGDGAGLKITDQLIQKLSAMRSDGNIVPLPSIVVEKRVLRGVPMAVVFVHPSDAPPVRFRGRTCIRVGSCRAVASLEEERRLMEKRRSRDLPFDLHVHASATLGDLDRITFLEGYLPSAIAPDILEDNGRTYEQQLASVRFVSVDPPYRPTVVGLLVVGKIPTDFIPGAYIQFLRINGTELTDPIMNREEIHGALPYLLRRMDDLLSVNIVTPTDIRSHSTEDRHPDYPLVALQQLARNAVMHRDYQTTNAPVRITWFNDRIEIQNPGGPFGQVTRKNFGVPGITDYRNPHIAEAMKTLGFVQRFGVGIQLARKTLKDNGNPDLDFDVQDNHVLVVVRK